MKVSLKTITPKAELHILEIARVSSTREDKSEPGLINYLIKNNHWSPFEHAFVTWEIETSKAIGIQLLRHRSNYFQEFSQRYQDVSKLDNVMFELYEVREQADHNRQSSTREIAELSWNEDQGYYFACYPRATVDQKLALAKTCMAYNMCEEAYRVQLDSGIARECARFVLPMATKTKMHVTQNVRSIIHWLDLRDDSHAQKEIQLIASEIRKFVIEHLPIISKARSYV